MLNSYSGIDKYMNKFTLQIILLSAFIFTFFTFQCCTSPKTDVDILIIGGGASGTAAGIQAARLNAKTLIVEETTWLGGMLTAAGVSAIDGNHNLPASIWGEFRDSLIAHYGDANALRTGWVSSVLFEPSVGNAIFQKICAHEEQLDVWHEARFVSAKYKEGFWDVKVSVNGQTKHVHTPILIDATELGDVAKHCGVNYHIGMESREITKEPIAPLESNDIIQDLTYVAILKDYGEDVTIERPEGYDSTLFACACINDLCITPKEPDRLWKKDAMIRYGKLPNNKYMINWPIEGNDYYLNILELSPREREKALKEAKLFTLSFLYFMQKDLGFNTLGLADDEFPTKDKLPFIPYHRESRRIEGKVRFTLNHVTHPYEQAQSLYRTNIAVGDYPVDHHHARYHGYDSLPNLYFHPIPSFGLPLGTLIPKETEGLIVAEKSISVSNLINGTTRLQPVVLQIGQAAGTLAALAIKNGCPISEVSVREVQKEILNSGGYLMPYLDVSKEHPLFKTYQRIGSTGILRGVGKNIGWANQTWLRADTLLMGSELDILGKMYKNTTCEKLANKQSLTVEEVLEIITEIGENTNTLNQADVYSTAEALFREYDLGDFSPKKPIQRGAFALLIDSMLKPFDKEVDIYGNYK